MRKLCLDSQVISTRTYTHTQQKKTLKLLFKKNQSIQMVSCYGRIFPLINLKMHLNQENLVLFVCLYS